MAQFLTSWFEMGCYELRILLVASYNRCKSMWGITELAPFSQTM